MSSPEDDGQLFSSPPLQSAQQPADQLYAENEDLDLASDYLSDAPSDDKSSLQQSFQRNYNAGHDSAANQVAAEEEHQELLDKDSRDSTSLPPRPNKFRGPPSTWRNWTAPERDLAASVDQLRANDLGVHLYNCFKLGQRNRTRNPGRRAQISRNSGEANEGPQWMPPKVWTAWPLPPGIVPREHDERRWEEDAAPSELYYAKSKRPGQHLHEMLVAQVLRKGKELFRDRQWGDEQHPASSTMRQAQRLQGRRRDSNGRFGAKEDDEVPDQKPVIMADDQRASEILQPTVQHMMTKLDDLLMGLHHARSAYVAVEDSGSESHSLTSERSASRGRSRKRKQKASKPDEDAEPIHPVSDSDENRHHRQKSASNGKIQSARPSSRRGRSQSFRGRKGRLGLRDWSDVLGIASLTGWQQNVVGKAAARCATLFEEGIQFRTLEEGKKVPKEDSYLPDASPLVLGQKSDSNTWRAREGPRNQFGGAMVGAVHVDGFLKPIEGKKSWSYSNKKQSKPRQS
ncbi:MAG: hypothetical protein Q9175_000617 [Cornicularia normoerica]